MLMSPQEMREAIKAKRIEIVKTFIDELIHRMERELKLSDCTCIRYTSKEEAQKAAEVADNLLKGMIDRGWFVKLSISEEYIPARCFVYYLNIEVKDTAWQ